MSNENYNNKDQVKAQVISFLSGKGGAGKTSVALGVSYLLNDAGLKVLLIDFDFATYGASYFYDNFYPSEANITGIYELMNEHNFELDEVSINVNTISLEIKEGLSFIPSRINFAKKLPLRDSIGFKEDPLASFLRSLLELHKKDYNFIIIDNQAGSNLTAKVSARVSDKVIIVTEFDPISSDAFKTLLIQIGDAFPEYFIHLINKMDVRESEDYKNYKAIL